MSDYISSGVAVYKLTAKDRLNLERGDLSKIPTAEKRGLSYPEPEARKGKLESAAWNGKVMEPAGAKWGMTADKMKALLDEGLTHRQIAKRTGIPHGTVAALIQRFKLSREWSV